MIPRVRPEVLIFFVIGLLEILIAFTAYRETVNVEDTTTALREGYLNEISHAVASAVQLSAKAGNIEAIDFDEGFKTFENMDPKGYYALGDREKASLHLVVLDSRARVVYDSLKRWIGHDLSRHSAVQTALLGGYGRSETHETDGAEMMSVVAPVFAGGKVIGAVMAAKSDFVLKPVVHRFQDTAVIVGIAAGAGVQVQEVNRLLNEFGQMQDMMKKMRGGGLMKMMKRLGGMKGMGGMGGMGGGGFPGMR